MSTYCGECDGHLVFKTCFMQMFEGPLMMRTLTQAKRYLRNFSSPVAVRIVGGALIVVGLAAFRSTAFGALLLILFGRWLIYWGGQLAQRNIGRVTHKGRRRQARSVNNDLEFRSEREMAS